MITMIGMIIGVILAAAGIFYLIKEGQDPESRKIYTWVTIAGVVIAAIATISRMMQKQSIQKKNDKHSDGKEHFFHLGVFYCKLTYILHSDGNEFYIPLII